MLSEQLSLISGVAVFAVAFSQGKGHGALGIAIGLTLGLLFGIGTFVFMRFILSRAVAYVDKPHPPLRRITLCWLVCLGALVGMVLPGFLVLLLARYIIRMLH